MQDVMHEIKKCNNQIIEGPIVLAVGAFFKDKLNILLIDTDTKNLDAIHVFEWEEKEQAIELANRYNKIKAFS